MKGWWYALKLNKIFALNPINWTDPRKLDFGIRIDFLQIDMIWDSDF